MKIVKILGGLGNQMFQYAFSKELERLTGEEVFLDLSEFNRYKPHNGFELERLFGIHPRIADNEDCARLATQPHGILGRIRRKYFTKKSHYIDRYFGFAPEVFDLSGDYYLEGYWQSEKYFGTVKNEVRNNYTFSRPLDARNVEFLQSQARPTCSVHVRRGDYLASRNLNVCGERYYANAISAMKARGIATFVVFSDDIEWCKSNLDFGERDYRFVDWNLGSESWQDMAMMRACDHHVVANSSFSWWAAWLGETEKSFVIAPSVWNNRQLATNDPYYHFAFDDIVPARWQRVDP